jgi:RNA polymerase sigma-70 factor (family 1)
MGQLYSNNTEEEGSKLIRPIDDQAQEPKIIGEETLLPKIFQQDPQRGCEILFRKYYANLCNHAIRFVYSKDIAEEIVSEVFANFWQGKVFEQINTSYQAYLYKAVRYRAYNYIRYELNRTAPLDGMENQYEAPVLTPDEILQYTELTRKVDTIIQHLPPQCRKAFQLNRLEGKKYAEIAAEMQITTSAVERLISRALAKLRTGLKDDLILAFLLISHLIV